MIAFIDTDSIGNDIILKRFSKIPANRVKRREFIFSQAIKKPPERGGLWGIVGVQAARGLVRTQRAAPDRERPFPGCEFCGHDSAP